MRNAEKRRTATGHGTTIATFCTYTRTKGIDMKATEGMMDAIEATRENVAVIEAILDTYDPFDFMTVNDEATLKRAYDAAVRRLANFARHANLEG